jgi:UDP-glucose 4-epimerase
VKGTQNVVAVAMKYSIPVVYASTGSVYMPIQGTPPLTEKFPGKGNSVYGCTKYMGELYVQKHTPHIILRYAHLYGKEKRMHGLIGGFLDRINRGIAPTLYGGKQSNDFTYIKDVAVANYLALVAPWDKWNQIYNVGTGEEITAEAAGRVVCDVSGWKGKVETKEQRGVDPDRFFYDVSKAEVMLGFKAKFDFAQGMADMFKDGDILTTEQSETTRTA